MPSRQHSKDMVRLLGFRGTADWVWRKSKRKWQKARFEFRPQWSTDRLCEVGNQSPEATLESLWGSENARDFCSWARRDSVVRAIHAVPLARAGALAAAEEVLRRKFRVFGTVVEFDLQEGIDWGLDVSSDARFALLPSHELRLQSAGRDPKYPWALGRLDVLMTLAQAVWLAESDPERQRYSNDVLSLWSSFVEDNPVGRGIHWASPMEVSLRAMNVAQAFRMCRPSWSRVAPKQVLEGLSALINHCEFVWAHLEDEGGVPNNHLIANYLGVFVVSALFPKLPQAEDWAQKSRRGLEVQMETQVLSDGFSFEGSTSYHRLALEMMTLAFLHGEASGRPFSDSFRQRLKKMFHIVQHYCSEKGRAPQIGDNDSGRVFPWANRVSLDHGYLLPLGAALFRDGTLKRQGDSFPAEAAWLLGQEGLERFESLASIAQPSVVSSYDSGIHVVAHGPAHLTVVAGPVGQQGVGGHSHQHQLSFEWHLGGEPVVVDSGSPSYTGMPAQRNVFRSVAAHNSFQIDELEHSQYSGNQLFAMPEQSRASIEWLSETESSATLRAHMNELPSVGEQVEVVRAFDLSWKEGVLKISDSFVGEKSHRVCLRLHAPHDRVRLRAPNAQELSKALAAGMTFPVGKWAMEWGMVGKYACTLLVEAFWQVNVRPGFYSPGYGEWREACVIELHSHLSFPKKATMVFLWGEELHFLSQDVVT